MEAGEGRRGEEKGRSDDERKERRRGLKKTKSSKSFFFFTRAAAASRLRPSRRVSLALFLLSCLRVCPLLHSTRLTRSRRSECQQGEHEPVITSKKEDNLRRFAFRQFFFPPRPPPPRRRRRRRQRRLFKKEKTLTSSSNHGRAQGDLQVLPAGLRPGEGPARQEGGAQHAESEDDAPDVDPVRDLRDFHGQGERGVIFFFLLFSSFSSLFRRSCEAPRLSLSVVWWLIKKKNGEREGAQWTRPWPPRKEKKLSFVPPPLTPFFSSSFFLLN